MVQGPTFLSLPASSGADWYLKLSSQYKRSAGRNLGDTRHGTPLQPHVQRYYLLVPVFVFLFSRYFVYACIRFPNWSAYYHQGNNKLDPRAYAAFPIEEIATTVNNRRQMICLDSGQVYLRLEINRSHIPKPQKHYTVGFTRQFSKSMHLARNQPSHESH